MNDTPPTSPQSPPSKSDSPSAVNNANAANATKASNAAPQKAPPPSPAAAKTSPPSSAASKPQKKKSGCLPILIFIFLLLASSYAIVQYPKTVARFTGWQPPETAVNIGQRIIAFISSSEQPNPAATKTETAAQTESESTPRQTPTPSPEAPPRHSRASGNPKQADMDDSADSATSYASSPATKPQTGATTRSDNANSANQVTQLQIALSQKQAEIDRLQTRQTRMEQQQIRLATQIAELQNKSADHNNLDMQLQIINLALRYSGDTQAAAAALRRLATLIPASDKVTTLLNEATRIEKMIPRAQHLTLLREIRKQESISTDDKNNEANTTTAADETNTASEINIANIGSSVASLFNIKRVQQRTTDNESVFDLVGRMEIYLLSGQEAAYWTLLNSTVRANPHISDLFQRLIAYGEPDYQLYLW